jgi:hypothetical protein
MSGPRIQTLRHGLPPVIQGKLDLRLAGGRCAGAPRPLGDLNAAMRDLDLADEEVLQLLEQRALVGFNIAVNPSGRGELRVLTRSLEDFRQSRGRAVADFGWPEIFQLIFPATALPLPPYTLTGLELNQALNCSRGHVENLASRHFEIVRPAGRGRGNTPRFKTTSVENWLKRRML